MVVAAGACILALVGRDVAADSGRDAAVLADVMDGFRND